MSILNFPSPILPGDRGFWGGAFGSGLSLSVAEISQQRQGLILVIAASARSAAQIKTEIAFFLGDDTKVFHFPDWETLPYDQFSPHQDITSQRLKTLFSLPQTRCGVVVVPVTTMMHRIPPVEFVGSRSFDYSVEII